MARRLAISVCVAFGLLVFNVPIPALGSSSQSPARVLINAPDMPAYDLSNMPGGQAPAKHPGAPPKSFRPNHVAALDSSAIGKLRSQGYDLVTNRDGEWQVAGVIGGERRLVTVVDGILPSGRDVVGFGVTDMPASSQVALFRAATVSAGTKYFLICSYAWMNSYYDDMHVHLCNVDATYIAAIVTIVEAAVGGIAGTFIGGVVGGVVGIAAGTIVAVLTLVFFWTHSDPYGNVDFVIPNWTMQPPYGGYILWSDVGRWDYMWDQCWINDGGTYYHPVCAY